MSYCVNCGVKLDSSLNKCPLCHTPVINPSELKKMETSSPFATQKGEMEKVKSKDVIILTTVFLATTAICCMLLNYLVFSKTLWSIPIIGLCAFFWIISIPPIAFEKMPVYISMLIDGLAMAGYLYMLSFMTSNKAWLTKLALPITALATVLVLMFTLLVKKISSSILSIALYFYVLIPILCVGIELLIWHYYNKPLHITWSAIVLVPCLIIDIVLITILSRKRLREAVRRRLHF